MGGAYVSGQCACHRVNRDLYCCDAQAAGREPGPQGGLGHQRSVGWLNGRFLRLLRLVNLSQDVYQRREFG